MAVLAVLIRQLGKVQGRIRLQKLVYLLQAMGVGELGRVRYRYHHYGPYSDDVSEALGQAVLGRVIRENAESFDDQWQRYSYEAGANLDDAAALLSPDAARRVVDTAEKTKSLHWRVLELAATIDFLKRVDRLSSQNAEIRALRLKPQCAPFLAQARELLQSLALHELN